MKNKKEIVFNHYENGIRLRKYILGGGDYISKEVSDNGWVRFVVSKGSRFCNTLRSIKECRNWYKNN